MEKIKLLIVGYGKMGKMVAENASYINAEVTAIYDPNVKEYSSLPLPPPRSMSGGGRGGNYDVAIEFTHPDSCFDNIKLLLENRIPVVSGTTGWFHKIKDLESLFNPAEISLIYGANFSIGMNLFYSIVQETTSKINKSGLYDIYGLESHHRAKADSPSGTARVLSEIILNNMTSKNNAVFDLNNQPLKENEFSFSSVRAGNIVGYHEIGFDSDFDELKLIHNAKNRKGFALGALMAASFAIKNKGIRDFKDIFKEIIISN